MHSQKYLGEVNLEPGCLFRFKFIGWNTMGTHIIYVNNEEYIKKGDANGLLDISDSEDVDIWETRLILN